MGYQRTILPPLYIQTIDDLDIMLQQLIMTKPGKYQLLIVMSSPFFTCSIRDMRVSTRRRKCRVVNVCIIGDRQLVVNIDVSRRWF